MTETTITEKIRNNDETVLGVSQHQISKEMKRFYNLSDEEGMRELFEAYAYWEMKNRDSSKSPEEVMFLSKRNLDYVATVTDCFIKSRKLPESMVKASKFPLNSVGDVTRFYRKAIGYQPNAHLLN